MHSLTHEISIFSCKHWTQNRLNLQENTFFFTGLVAALIKCIQLFQVYRFMDVLAGI